MSNFNKQIQYIYTLSNKYIQALQTYSNSSFAIINKVLRSSHEPTILDVDKYDEFVNIINLIDEVFEGIPPLDEDVILWRGVTMKEKLPDNFIDCAYMSTTIDKNVALKFSQYQVHTCCLFEVAVPKGTKVIPLYSIATYEEEWEVLLPRNGVYKIVKSDFTPRKNSMVIKYKQNLPTRKFVLSNPKIHKKGWVIQPGTDNILVDNNGKEWVVEPYDKVLNLDEYLAYMLYKLFKCKATDMKMIQIGDYTRLVKRKVDKIPLTKQSIEKVKEEFIIDILMGNLNVVREMYIDESGDLVRGKLILPTPFPKLDSTMFKVINLEKGLKKITSVTASQIKDTVKKFGDHKPQLAEIIIDRIESIIKDLKIA